MTATPPRRCPRIGCRRYTPCDLHDTQDHRDSTRRGYDWRWAKTRATKLAQTAFCEYAGCDAPAGHVDHKDGRGPLGPRGHDLSNLQSLCAEHHGRLTAQDMQG